EKTFKEHLPSALHPLLSILLTIKIIRNEKSILFKAQLIKRQVWRIRIDAFNPVQDRLLGHQDDQVTVDRKAGRVVHGKTSAEKLPF
ncbi:hypothetical protein, partial [Duganella sacchari]